MRLAQLSAIAALTLSLAAGTALAASTSNDDSQGTTNTADTAKTPTPVANNPTSNDDGGGTTNSANPIDTAMSKAGSTSESRGTFFSGLGPADREALKTHCQTGIDGNNLTQSQKAFCSEMMGTR